MDDPCDAPEPPAERCEHCGVLHCPAPAPVYHPELATACRGCRTLARMDASWRERLYREIRESRAWGHPDARTERRLQRDAVYQELGREAILAAMRRA